MKEEQARLDDAVAAAYGWKNSADVLKDLLALNLSLKGREKAGEFVQGPGLPVCVKDSKPFISKDCIQPPKL